VNTASGGFHCCRPPLLSAAVSESAGVSMKRTSLAAAMALGMSPAVAANGFKRTEEIKQYSATLSPGLA